jgi:hypothetical protein
VRQPVAVGGHDLSTIGADFSPGGLNGGWVMRKFSILLALAAAVAGSALAGDEATADPRVGEKVDRICFGRNIDGFKTVKGMDDAVLLEKGVNDWYLATLSGACSYSRLKWAMGVAIDQRPSGGCVTPGDHLIFTNSVTGDMSFPNTTRCVINGIYEWNEDAATDAENDDQDTE